MFEELADPDTPPTARTWVARAPVWFTIHADPALELEATAILDAGERAAIALATTLGAHLLLMDERAGVAVARRMGMAATGTLGVLDLAARRGLVDLADSFMRLKTTSFYYRAGLLDTLLAQHKSRT